MDDNAKNRLKSSMVIYALEKSLGNYVIDNESLNKISEENKKVISEREKSKGNSIEKNNIAALVESSYLDEIFNLAIDTTEGTSRYSNMKELKTLCSFLEIFNIRNAISHPNRPFPEFYWFRSATIASDPLIEKLELVGVRQALNSAVEENLNIPPEEWFDNVPWAIPNNLPISFDHEITGLLGRDLEFKELHKTLSSPRNSLIAVVAPGGIGKTALILQFLKDLSLSPDYNSSINAIIFCTLKNERLTADGIEQIEAINGVSQIKESILSDLNSLFGEDSYSSFEEASESLALKPILICIDNLETLLIHSQKEFLEFNQSLPIHWRIIVTSRISINSATTVTLDSLRKKHSASLCRNYFKKRGYQNIEQSAIENIVKMTNNNPLAIRLTIDLYSKGSDLSLSIEKSQKDIAAFSYKNLIESLHENSITVLEALYVIGESNKSELIHMLELTNEEIAEAINELSKTSLIVRTINDIDSDCYNLSDSIRDLLLINPKNIEVRISISERVQKRKLKISEQKKRDQKLGLSEFDDNYVAPNTDASIHSLIVDLNKYLSRIKPRTSQINELVNLKHKFDDLIIYNNKDYQLNYHYSRVLRELKDKTGELNKLKQSEKNNSESPRTKNAIALHHFFNSDYQEALEMFNELHDAKYNFPENSTEKFAINLTKHRIKCLLFLEYFDELLKTTEDWEKEIYWSAMYGTYRASTVKAQNEGIYDTDNTEKALNQVLDIFEKIFTSEGYGVVACIECNKILKYYVFVATKINFSKILVNRYVKFVSVHFFNLFSKLRNDSIDSKESREFLRKVYSASIKPNPLHKVSWYSENSQIYDDEEHIRELEEQGYEIVEVYNIPENEFGASNFIFAKNNDELQFYLHVDNFNNGWSKWGYIKKGTKLGITFDKTLDNGKTIPATKIIEIEKYEK